MKEDVKNQFMALLVYLYKNKKIQYLLNIHFFLFASGLEHVKFIIRNTQKTGG